MLEVIIFSSIGGLFSLWGGVLLLGHKKAAKHLAAIATPFAAGALLAAVFLDLLPEGIDAASSDQVLFAALVGILIFFIAERFLRGFHHHHEKETFTESTTALIVTGDTLHNALDGVAIAAAFLIDTPTGIVTTIAVAAHEIPQEIGDFGLLLARGMSRGRVLLFNAMSALATTAAAVITFALGSEDKLPIGVMLGLSAGFLLYISMSDLIPTIHGAASRQRRTVETQTLLLLLGVVVVGVTIRVVEHLIGHA